MLRNIALKEQRAKSPQFFYRKRTFAGKGIKRPTQLLQSLPFDLK
jgi:hypothetical protein